MLQDFKSPDKECQLKFERSPPRPAFEKEKGGFGLRKSRGLTFFKLQFSSLIPQIIIRGSDKTIILSETETCSGEGEGG